MLYWSNKSYQFTLGVGTLALAGMSAELWNHVLPMWLIVICSLIPFALFIFIDPEYCQESIVRPAHTVAAIWYILSGTGLLAAIRFIANPLPRGWPVYPLFVVIGAIPCVIVICRMAAGTYLARPKVQYEQIEPPTEGWEGILLFKEVTEAKSDESIGDAEPNSSRHQSARDH